MERPQLERNHTRLTSQFVIHGLNKAFERARYRDASSVGIWLVEGNCDFLVTLLQFDSGYDGLAVDRPKLRKRSFVTLDTLLADRDLERRRHGVRDVRRVGARLIGDSSNLVPDVVGNGLS